MYETLPLAGPARPSASEANEAIRHLVETWADGEWPSEAYEFLLGEWAAATREEVGAAACHS
ncbi:hypothetical protein [Streptomyces bambusae]|uniref:Uncharacterized protein n=1 Tax=Streptomyces bambusae TaxID=1550616 RepID=A0ABS6ZEC9_9ACTN|nr:hypothetical protein [Streptomyces bambusae]MBW5485941.1 hypothetical protein [Streptomyces bambusae]